jgi:hypothetical protein
MDLKYGINLLDMVSDCYSDLVWLNEMIGISRNTDNRNIILVPCVGKTTTSVLINKEK